MVVNISIQNKCCFIFYVLCVGGSLFRLLIIKLSLQSIQIIFENILATERNDTAKRRAYKKLNTPNLSDFCQ